MRPYYLTPEHTAIQLWHLQMVWERDVLKLGPPLSRRRRRWRRRGHRIILDLNIGQRRLQESPRP